MENTRDSSHEEEQGAAPPTEYRALIQMTRPLMVVKDTALPPGLPICRDQAGWPRTFSPGIDSVLNTDEIVPIETPAPPARPDAEPPAAQGDSSIAAPQDEQDGAADWGSDLTLRIYLGMS